MLSGGKVPSVSKESVSLLFLYASDFSILRGTLEPCVMLDMLDRLITKLDQLAAFHGVQRIDVIEGCFIAAANYSLRQPTDHAVRLARFAVAAIAAAAATAIDPARPELRTVQLLGGAHVGTVWGGLLGTHGGRKHTLLGDAVNVASRMASHGAPGALQCSAAFAAAVVRQAAPRDGLRLAPRVGGVELKGCGRAAAYWLGAAGAAGSADSSGFPADDAKAAAGGEVGRSPE